jgi:hypothetical protein
VSDLDELVRTKRFEEIHDARRQVIEDERSINEALATGRVGDSQARKLFQRAVDAYVRELEYLLNPPDGDEPSEYWTETEIGHLQLPDGRVARVQGLGSYLDLNEEITVQVQRKERERYDSVATVTEETATVQPSWELLRSAFRKANAAASALGLELDLSEGDEAGWETDYRNGDHETTA